MLYIFNKTLPDSKNILYALMHLYGINRYQSNKICANIGVNPLTTINKLKTNHVNRLTNYIKKNIKIEQHLKQLKKNEQKKLLEIKTIRGIRKSLGLPVRGQRTHTNAKTCKKFKFKFNTFRTNNFLKNKRKGKFSMQKKKRK